jgi:hypothetical protein
MTRYFLLIGFLIVNGFVVARQSAQAPTSAQFTFDRTTAYVGELIHLTFTAEFPTGSIAEWPTFPAIWPPFEVVNISEVRITEKGSTQLYTQELTIVSWQIGQLSTGRVVLTYSLPSAAEPLQIEAVPVMITIQSVLVPGDTALRPLKPPVSIPAIPLWLPLAALAGIALVSVYLWRVKGWKPLASERNAHPINKPIPSQKAIIELERIQAWEASPRAICAAVASSVRSYLLERFSAPAALTTDELTIYLRASSGVSPELQRKLGALLRRADLVRFAPPLPDADLARQLTSAARRWIDAAESETEGEDAT